MSELKEIFFDLETNLWFVESILGAKAEVNKNLVKIQGIGYSLGSSMTN